MRKNLICSFLFLFTFLLCANDIFAQTVNSGTEGSAELKAAVIYWNFNSNPADEVLIGNSDLSLFNSTDVDWDAPSTKHISFTFNGNNQISTTVYSVPTNTSVSYNFVGAVGPVNYFEIEVKAPSSGRTITFTNVTLNSDPLGQSFSAPSTNTHNVTGLDLSAGFTIEGDIVTTGSPGGGDNMYLEIRVGYLAPSDGQAPVVTNVLATPDYALVGTDIVLTANVDDSNTGNSNIQSAEYSLNGTDWFAMNASDGAFDSPSEDVTATLSGLSCGEYNVCVRGTDALNNTSTSVCYEFTLYDTGSVSGIIDVAGNGVGGVTVKLLELNGDPILVGTTMTAPGNTAGYYQFTGLVPNQYRVEIVTPLGFTADEETKDVEILICDNDETVDFTLTPVAISNDARSKGYWKHQFDVYLKGKGSAQETQANLNSYIAAIGNHYIPHFASIFNVNYNSQYWSDILSYGGPDMYQKAKAQLAALILNMASLKISQAEVVTADGRDVADVITHASTILSDIASTKPQLELAKDIAEAVCNQVMIASGKVTDYNIVYKNGYNNSDTNIPSEYALLSNYPNPFNPSTVISYALPTDGFVTLKIYDILGNEIASLVSERQTAGLHSVHFDASGLTSGIYLYAINSGSFTSTKKMILLR